MVEPIRGDAELFRIVVHEVNPAIRIEVVSTLVGAFDSLRWMAAESTPVVADLLIVTGDAPTIRARDLVRRFNADPRSSSIGVAILTASEDPVERDHLEDLGIVAYWQKPGAWDGYVRVAHEVDGYLASKAFTQGRTPPRGARVSG